MTFWMHIREALANLFSAKLRSILAISGILVGTGSVVALITSSQLATDHALAQFKSLGTNLLSVSLEYKDSGNSHQVSQSLTEDNIKQMTRRISTIDLAAPYVTQYYTFAFSGATESGEVIGADSRLTGVGNIQLAKGRMISPLDNHQFFCVIGSDIAKKFKERGVRNPIGKQILVGNWYFTIVGIAKPWKPNLFLYASLNKGMIIPLGAAFILRPETQIRNILLRLTSDEVLDQSQKNVEAFLTDRFTGIRVNFRNPAQLIDLVGKQQETFTWLLGAIGGISLIVGGIGVMNIMLVSVVERRREIGIRMAIGARQKDIMLMFLIESVILTVLGGIIGVIIGLAISVGIAHFSKWELHFYLMPPVLGFVVSALVGLVSGIYPSYSASKLDPIQTLQSD
jgi:putative ABC transport system permease protein